MPLTIAQLAPIKARDPYLYEALTKIVNEIALTQKQAGVSGSGQLPAPPSIGSISVTAAGGTADVAIQDNVANIQRGIEYFAEWDTSPNFTNAHVVPMGSTRNTRVQINNLTTYWRGYSMYLGNDQPSAKVYFGSASKPTAVVGGGAAGPAPQPTQGSGTSTLPGYGFGGKLPLLRRS